MVPRYVFDPARGSAVIAGFPSVILPYAAEDVGAHRQDGEHVIIPGRYERDLVDWARELAPADKQFVDVGAHAGSWTLVMATHFREVHAFEPQRLIFQQLCGNVALNGLENVHAHNVGLDGVSGTTTLLRAGIDRGSSSARRDVAQHFAGARMLSPEVIVVKPLDTFADVLTNVGLVKIDVEGMELSVLRGAEAVLRANGLPKLLVECWAGDWYRKDKARLLGFLDALGYRVVPIRGYADMLLAEKK